jgi:hypothetical protein
MPRPQLESEYIPVFPDSMKYTRGFLASLEMKVDYGILWFVIIRVQTITQLFILLGQPFVL